MKLKERFFVWSVMSGAEMIRVVYDLAEIKHDKETMNWAEQEMYDFIRMDPYEYREFIDAYKELGRDKRCVYVEQFIGPCSMVIGNLSMARVITEAISYGLKAKYISFRLKHCAG